MRPLMMSELTPSLGKDDGTTCVPIFQNTEEEMFGSDVVVAKV
jgi:hypothetical protein